MRNLDYLCAWMMLVTAAIFLVVIEIWRPLGVGYDTPLFWIPVAMINFLRLRNGYRGFDGLRTFAITANLMVLVLETIRLGEWGAWMIRYWGVYYSRGFLAMDPVPDYLQCQWGRACVFHFAERTSHRACPQLAF